MANLIQLVKSTFSLLVIYLIAATIEISCGGKGKGGSDIILYKNNLLIRGNKGKGNLVIADSHGHHGHHEHHGHEEHHGHHHGHEGHSHHQDKFIMSVLSDSKGKGKGKSGGSTMNMGNGGKMKSKGSEMNWEDLIMGGGKY